MLLFAKQMQIPKLPLCFSDMSCHKLNASLNSDFRPLTSDVMIALISATDLLLVRLMPLD